MRVVQSALPHGPPLGCKHFLVRSSVLDLATRFRRNGTLIHAVHLFGNPHPPSSVQFSGFLSCTLLYSRGAAICGLALWLNHNDSVHSVEFVGIGSAAGLNGWIHGSMGLNQARSSPSPLDTVRLLKFLNHRVRPHTTSLCSRVWR